MVAPEYPSHCSGICHIYALGDVENGEAGQPSGLGGWGLPAMVTGQTDGQAGVGEHIGRGRCPLYAARHGVISIDFGSRTNIV